MTTEQTAPTDSVEAATALMESKLFGTEETPEPEAASVESEVEQSETEDDDEPAVETFEFEADDGEKYHLPAKLKAAVERHKDYTQKTQQLAKLAEQAQDRLMFAEAREQIAQAVMDDVATLKGLQGELARFQGIDWSAVYNADPGQVPQLQRREKDLERQVAEAQRSIQAKVAKVEQNVKAHSQQQWQTAVVAAKERIGSLTQAEDNAMLEQVQSLGFTESELKMRFADPRFLQAIYKASKWDALQSGKGKSLAALQGVPPVIKPGASDPAMSAKMGNLNWAKQMKNAKTNSEKASLAEAKLTRFFGR